MTETIDGSAASGWTVLPSLTTLDLYSVWGESGSNIVVVGGTLGSVAAAPGLIAHYDGTSWSKIPTGVNFLGVSGHGILFAVGEFGGDGRSLKFDGSSWSHTSMVAPEILRGVWSPISSDAAVWAVGDNGTLLKSNGFATTWTPIATGTTAGLNAAWGSSINDVYVVGQDGTVLHFAGTPASWTKTQPSNELFRAVWGSSSDDVYIVGGGFSGTVLHSTTGGQKWTRGTSPGGLPAFYGVWGSSATDIYAVGEGGAIYHSTGNDIWNPEASPTTQELRGIWGSSATDIYIVGRGGTILHK